MFTHFACVKYLRPVHAKILFKTSARCDTNYYITSRLGFGWSSVDLCFSTVVCLTVCQCQHAQLPQNNNANKPIWHSISRLTLY